MNKEEQLLRKRLVELADVCFQRDVPVHTDFLNLYEQTIFLTMVHSFPNLNLEMTGGYELAERKIVCFLPSYTESGQNIPVRRIEVKAVHEKFAQDLTHRDYLGAIMNLGIERSKIGDILVDGSQCSIICMEDMADYIARGLTFVSHTKIDCRVCDTFDFEVHPHFDRVSGSVASERLDNIIVLAYHLSRSKAAAYIDAEKVFINSRLVISNHEQVKSGDVISVRGLGKFVYHGMENQTKKGRLFVSLDRYC